MAGTAQGTAKVRAALAAKRTRTSDAAIRAASLILTQANQATRGRNNQAQSGNCPANLDWQMQAIAKAAERRERREDAIDAEVVRGAAAPK